MRPTPAEATRDTVAQRPLAQQACATCDDAPPTECATCEPALPTLTAVPGAPAVQAFSLGDEVGVFGEGGTQGFMKQLRQDVTDTANSELAEVGRTADECPYIQHWLSHYEGRDANHLDRAIQRYARPGERTIDGYREAILSRVRGALKTWKASGEISGIPDDAPGPGGVTELATSLGAGDALDSGLRGQLESAYGADLGGVRVHTDGRAAAMAEGMSALAFTVGNDIAFAPGHYQPGSPAGNALIAHEVAHTIQQGGVQHPANAVSPDQEQALEHEADVAAAGALSGSTAAPQPRTGLSLQRCGGGPDCTPMAYSGLRLDIEAKRNCGLLDAPFRPPNVGAFPEYRLEDDLGSQPMDPDCYPSLGGGEYEMAAAMAAGAGSMAMGKFAQAQWPAPRLLPPARPMPGFRPGPGLRPLPPPRPMPIPRPMPRPIPIRPAPAPAPAPAPVPAPAPAPGPYPVPPLLPMPSHPDPDVRPDDQRYLDRLSPGQTDYYRWLREAENLQPEPGEDLDDELPQECPDTEPGQDEEEDDDTHCVAYNTSRRGGHREHDDYATAKSGSTFDYYARGPSMADMNYDGKTPLSHIVWEVKVRHGWFFNCASASLRDVVLRRWKAQLDRGNQVASECGYSHIWACKDPWVARYLRGHRDFMGTPIVAG